MRRPDVRDVGGGGDLVLSLAVVAERGGLDHGRRADACDGIPELVERGRAGKRRRREAVIGEKRLLARALLRGVQRQRRTAAPAPALRSRRWRRSARSRTRMSPHRRGGQTRAARPGPRRTRSLRRRPPVRSACLRLAKTCGRGSPSAARRCVNIRPSCPLPSTPSAAPGAMTRPRPREVTAAVPG